MTNFYMTHPFHLVTPSPWPILTSFSIMNNLTALANWFHSSIPMPMLSLMQAPTLLLCLYQWWRDITREATYQGLHTQNVYMNMRIGMMLFILSEALFFFSFFWAYFHFSLSPSIEIGQMWPPLNIAPFNLWDVPLLNTIILITSGMTLTWSHHSLVRNDFNTSTLSLIYTISLGLYFSALQLLEYLAAPFTISDSVYGSIFFLSTGFHGLHVIVGTLMLIVMLHQMTNLKFSPTHHFGFEAASWYWHFVDIIWLFLYLSVYGWGTL